MTFPQDAEDLAGGGRIPLLGFGTWQIKGAKARRAVGWALDAGYRHLDTATIYGNEREVGAGLADSGVARDDVFVTTKCPPRNAGHELDTLRTSLDLLGTDHVDLWLIHWPGRSGADLDIWRAYIEARDKGLARAIGVSNYSLLTDGSDAAARVASMPPIQQARLAMFIVAEYVRGERKHHDIALAVASIMNAVDPQGWLDRQVEERHRIIRDEPPMNFRWLSAAADNDGLPQARNYTTPLVTPG